MRLKGLAHLECKAERIGRNSMLTIIILLAVFIGFGIAALRWGVDSRDGFASCEWERRWHWSKSIDDQRGDYWSIL